MEKKPYTPSETAQAILNVLADATDPMSLADINAVIGGIAKPGHTSTLVKQGLIVSADQESVCPTCGHKDSHKVYSLVR